MTKDLTRILYIDSCLGLAGGQFSLLEILKFLDRSRFLPIVCSPHQSGLEQKCKELDIAWAAIPFESAHLSSRRRSGSLSKARDLIMSSYGVFYLARKIRQMKIDLVHANTFKAALVGGIACFITRKPMIFHDRLHIAHQPLGWLVAALATWIVAISEGVMAKHTKLFSEKLSLIPPGIDTTVFKPGEESNESGSVCYVGRISAEKGIDRLVECAKTVLSRVPTASFLIGGEPFTDRDRAYHEDLRRRIGELGLQEKFEFLGYVYDVRNLISRIGVLVLPSKKEPLGRVMLEAMALEKPVVAFNTGGPSEVIRDQVNGLLVEAGNVRGLANAIVNLLEDKQMAKRLGAEGRKTVVSRFSSRKVTDQIMSVYDWTRQSSRCGR